MDIVPHFALNGTIHTIPQLNTGETWIRTTEFEFVSEIYYAWCVFVDNVVNVLTISRWALSPVKIIGFNLLAYVSSIRSPVSISMNIEA